MLKTTWTLVSPSDVIKSCESHFQKFKELNVFAVYMSIKKNILIFKYSFILFWWILSTICGPPSLLNRYKRFIQDVPPISRQFRYKQANIATGRTSIILY